MKNRIDEIMQQKKISVSELLEKVQISRTSFYDIRNGKQIPKLNTALDIAKALDVNVYDLFKKEDSSND